MSNKTMKLEAGDTVRILAMGECLHVDGIYAVGDICVVHEIFESGTTCTVYTVDKSDFWYFKFYELELVPVPESIEEILARHNIKEST